jgi:ubiquinone/menaquinone biosynthesis C-methylase UbiE
MSEVPFGGNKKTPEDLLQGVPETPIDDPRMRSWFQYMQEGGSPYHALSRRALHEYIEESEPVKDLDEELIKTLVDPLGRIANISPKLAEKVRLKPDMYLAEFGSGSGLLLADQLGNKFGYKGEMVGYDFSSNAVYLAQQHADKLGLDNLTFKEADIEKKMPREEKKYDILFISFIGYYIRDMYAVLEAAKEKVKKGGLIVAETRSEDNLISIYEIMRSTANILNARIKPPRYRNWNIEKAMSDLQILYKPICLHERKTNLWLPRDSWDVLQHTARTHHPEVIDPQTGQPYDQRVVRAIAEPLARHQLRSETRQGRMKVPLHDAFMICLNEEPDKSDEWRTLSKPGSPLDPQVSSF